MTLEELRIEAEKHGYRLAKITPTVKLLPCPVCGSKRTSEWFRTDGSISRECNKCSFRGFWAATKKKAKENWNKAVLEYKED